MISVTNNNGLTQNKEYNIITEGVDGSPLLNGYWVCNDFGVFIEIYKDWFITKEQFNRDNKLNELGI